MFIFATPGIVEASGELLNNPGFESGTSGWFGNSSTIAQSTAQVHSGTYSCFVTNRQGKWASSQQNIKTVLLNNGQGYYTCSAWVKMFETTDRATVIVKINDSTGDHYFSSNYMSVDSTSWNQVIAALNITWTGTLNSAYLYFQTFNSYQAPQVYDDMYIDDCSLVADGGFLSNPGFENGTTGWTGNNCTIAQSAAQVHRGSYSCLVSNRSGVWAGPRQDIKSYLLANGQRNYIFSTWVKLSQMTDQAAITVEVNDDTGNHYYSSDWLSVNSTSWNQVSVMKNIPWTGTLNSAYLYVQTKTYTYDMYVDDCSFEITDWIPDWQDDFNGTSLDMTKWYIADKPSEKAQNVSVDNGQLVLKIQQIGDGYYGAGIMSGVPNTQSYSTTGTGWKKALNVPFKLETRIRWYDTDQDIGSGAVVSSYTITDWTPISQGSTTYSAVEMDQIEHRGSTPGDELYSFHRRLWPDFPQGSETNPESSSSNNLGGLADTNWHTFVTEVDTAQVRYYCDGVLRYAVNYSYTDVYDFLSKPSAIVLSFWNTSSGFGGENGLDTSKLPAYQYVDYVKVYTK